MDGLNDDALRREISAVLAEPGAALRPIDIVRALGKRGVATNKMSVNRVLYNTPCFEKAGGEGGPRWRACEPAGVPAAAWPTIGGYAAAPVDDGCLYLLESLSAERRAAIVAATAEIIAANRAEAEDDAVE